MAAWNARAWSAIGVREVSDVFGVFGVFGVFDAFGVLVMMALWSVSDAVMACAIQNHHRGMA
ncbi:hypothetical protein [Streptomyces sp. S816]|uniref:hypothetical protein n=1 Tax=Streptomyces sp. S816 TaxID=2283197 RepID=UPI00109CBE78|nr:hypothetical protein [Streptomyces sp. S816]